MEPVRMKNGIGTYLRQSLMIMRNESVKFLRGKKLLLFTVLIALVLVLLTFLPYALGESLPDNSLELTSLYVTFVPTIILLFATLFSSTSLVSEFEERTALILFTRPVKKSSIMLGKLLASMLIGILFLGIYYGATCAVSMAVTGGIEGEILTSFGLSLVYLFCMTGIALLISSVVKKGSTAAILTFVTFLLIFPIISSVLTAYGVECWWMPNEACNSIYTLFGTFSYYGPVDVVQSAGVMGVWGLITALIAYYIFRRRDF